MPEAVGFFTDTTVCIGCKACQVACHQWNDLPAGKGPGQHSLPVLSGSSYDNTGGFSDVTWRHVKFIEQFSADRSSAAWLMMSDVCKHCANAPCLEVCPTGAILRTEFDTVYIHEPACNGCRDCVAACPFGVVRMSPTRHVAQKCTFCYDRLRHNLPPACAQACPTQSIRFGPLNELKQQAQARVAQLHDEGQTKAYLYGADEKVLGGLNAFYLLMDWPETYGLPAEAKLPSRSVPRSALWSIVTACLTALGMLFAFRSRRVPSPPGPTPSTGQGSSASPASEGLVGPKGAEKAKAAPQSRPPRAPVPAGSAGRPACVRCRRVLVALPRTEGILMGGEGSRRVELRCADCGISFCMDCAGRLNLQTTCPQCGRFSTPPLFVLPES